MIRTVITASALTLGAVAVEAEVINRRIPCQYNGGKWTEVHYINQDENYGDFTLTWDDGPRMSYVWDKPGHGTYSFMVTDKLGGRWGVIYPGYPSRPGDNSAFMLTNHDNNNVIKCLGINMGLGAG